MADGRRYEKYSNRTAAVGCGGCDAAQCYRYCSNLLRCTVADFEEGGSSRLQSPFGRRTDDVTVLVISDNLKTCSKTRTWKHAVDVGGVGLATLLWLWPEHGTTTFRQRSRPRRRCWSSANNSKTFLFQSAFHWLNDGSRWTELQRSRVLTVTEISACWMIIIVTGTSAAAGFWLGRVNCRLRWRKF